MGPIAVFQIVCLLLSIFSHVGFTQRTKDKMYKNIDGAYACFRRLNGTHQFGCSSPRAGNVGVLHVINSDLDLDWLVKEGLASPYIAILRPAMFSREVLTVLKTSGKINGVLLVNSGSTDHPKSFSHEDSCPNRYSGLSTLEHQSCGSGQSPVWNPNGSSIMLIDWGFPIFYITDLSHIESVYKCSEEHNQVAHPADQLDRPLCALQLRSHMFAAGDSRKCLKRNSYSTLFSQVTFCDPLGGRNVWQTLFPRSNHLQESVSVASQNFRNDSVMEANRSMAVLAARLDASSLFDGLVPGSVGAVTSIVTLLATSELLHRMLPNRNEYDKNVLFLLLTGESFDYIGSSRVVYDMKRGTFPVKPDASVRQPPPIGLHHLGLFVELSQINNPLKDQTLYVHRTPTSSSKKEVADATEKLKSVGEYYGINVSSNLPPSQNLPPSSLQTFLATDPDIPGLVLTDHPLEYRNQYYHSVYDDKVALGYKYANLSQLSHDSIQVYIANVSAILANTLYEFVTGSSSYTGAAVPDVVLVDEMLHCYLEQSNCTLFQSANGGNNVGQGTPLSLYVGVGNLGSMLTIFTGAVLAMLTGKHTDHNETYCHNNASSDQVYQYIWVSSEWGNPNSTKVCVQTTMNFSSAVSPAFIIDGYDMTSGIYSTWTESVWPELTARLFLKPSFKLEVLTLSTGISVLVLSFAAVYFIKARKEILFSPGSEEERAPLIANQAFTQVFS